MFAVATRPAQFKEWATSKVDSVVSIAKAGAIKAKHVAAPIGAGAMGLAIQARAAVPAEVTTALTQAKDDVLVIGGAVLVVIIAAAAFKLIRRAI